jgi:hypothetical protein
MRGFLTGFSVSVAFIVGSVVSTAQAGDEHVVVEQRWAYFCFEEPDADDVNFKANAAGARGWELVAASPGTGGSIWCFRQPRP